MTQYEASKFGDSGQQTKRALPGVMMMVMMTAAGCVQVNAPDRPIEIVLNINIRQEVVYRLDGDARALIQQNAEIF